MREPSKNGWQPDLKHYGHPRAGTRMSAMLHEWPVGVVLLTVQLIEFRGVARGMRLP